MLKIIKVIDEREPKKTNKKQKNGTRGTEAIAKCWEINDLVERLS